MKKLINARDDVLKESLAGFAAAHADLVKVAHDPTFVARASAPAQGKVALGRRLGPRALAPASSATACCMRPVRGRCETATVLVNDDVGGAASPARPLGPLSMCIGPARKGDGGSIG